MDPIFKEDFIENEMAINEVKFYWFNSSLLGFVQDKFFKMIDLRQSKSLYQNTLASAGEMFTLDFSMANPFLLATGDSQGVAKLWDIRNSS